MQETQIEAAPATGDAYLAALEAERAKRVDMLLADVGFLTLAGLFWLQPGDNRIGTAPDNDIILPPASAPEYAGLFTRTDADVTLTLAPGVHATIGDATNAGTTIATPRTLQTDAGGAPDYIHLNDLVMLVLQRGDRQGVRLYDRNHAGRTRFAGLRWYPIDPAWRIVADYIPHDPPHPINIVDVTGYAFQVESPGYAQFEWQGQTYRLEAQDRGQRLFFNFADATNRDTTYGAGRFLYTSLPQNGNVELDFNRATNPFCAYTPYATCSTPPRANRLGFRVEAGEMTYQEAG